MKEDKALEIIRNEMSNFLDNQISFDVLKELSLYKETIKFLSEVGKFKEARDIYDDLLEEYNSLDTDDPIIRREIYDTVEDIFHHFSKVLENAGIKIVAPDKKPDDVVEGKSKIEKKEEGLEKERVVDISKTTEESLTPEEREDVKVIKETVEKEKLKEFVSPEIITFLIYSGMNYLKERNLRQAAYVYVKIYEVYPKLENSEKKKLRPLILELFKNIKEKTFFSALTNLTGFLNTIEQSLKQSKELVDDEMLEEASREINVVKSLHEQIPDRFRKEKEKYYDDIMKLYNTIHHELNLLKKAKLIKNLI